MNLPRLSVEPRRGEISWQLTRRAWRRGAPRLQSSTWIRGMIFAGIEFERHRPSLYLVGNVGSVLNMLTPPTMGLPQQMAGPPPVRL